MQEGSASRGAAAGCQQHIAILQIVVAEAQPARLLCCEDVLQGINLQQHAALIEQSGLHAALIEQSVVDSKSVLIVSSDSEC